MDEKARNDRRLAALMPKVKKKKPPPTKKATATKTKAKRKSRKKPNSQKPVFAHGR